MMTRDKMITRLKGKISATRLTHSFGVEYTAACLAMVHGEDVEKARIAGLLHDCAKGLPTKTKLEKARKHGLPVSKYEEKNPDMLHAKLGAYYARYKYDVVDFSVEIIIVLAVSILVKLWMMYFNTKVGKRIDSPTLAATAADSRNDVITTSAVLVAAVIAHISGLNLDGIIGFLVALFILYSGIGIARDTINPLLGEPASEELTKLVYDETLKSDKRVLGVHDLMVHDYGPGQRFASEHVEVDAKEDVLAAHEMIDEIERMFEEKHKIHMVIHYDPVVTDDDEVNEMKEYVESHLADIDEQLKLHDFRIVRSKERTKLIFDLAIPFDFKGKEDELQKSLDKIVASKDKKYCTVITFDLV